MVLILHVLNSIRQIDTGVFEIALINGSKLDQLITAVAIREVFPNARLESFSSAPDAMDFFFKKEFYPDLVILDLNIGELSGKAFINLMRNTRNLNNSPVIVLSELGDERDVLSCGAADFYYLPSSFNSLVRTIEEIKFKWLFDSELYSLISDISVQ